MSEVLTGVQKAEADAVQILEKAQTQVEQIQREAERKARGMDQVVRAELTEEINALQKSVEGKAKIQAQKILSNADNEVTELEEQGKKNTKKTVDFIIKAVYTFGGGRD
ncbi:MAG: hypothetical protein ACFE89_08650 [Candidatus Hodarchaeota archaeon]